MKANFKYDPSFPDIDASGHPDDIGFFNVKGGGSTNTTCFDPFIGECHVFRSFRSAVSLSSGSSLGLYGGCVVTPSDYDGGATSGSALNTIPLGDGLYRRHSDRVMLHRIVVNGVVERPAGQSGGIPPVAFPPPLPKAFVALVLDKHSSTVPGGAPSFSVDGVFIHGMYATGVAGSFISGVPVLAPEYQSRFSVLCFDIIDFERVASSRWKYLLQYDGSTTIGGPLPVPEQTVNDVLSEYYFHGDSTAGFRFDVDLDCAMCSFKSDDASHNSCLGDLGLYVVGILFDGSTACGTLLPVPGEYNYLTLQFQSQLYFTDALAPKAFAAAPGANGDVVPDEEIPLAILADQSGLMAGDGTFLERPHKRSKASMGFYNFKPRSGDAMLFEDDPEFARLQGRKGASRSRVSDRNRRALSYRRVSDDAEEPVEPFQFEPRFRDDVDGAEPPRRRGKY